MKEINKERKIHVKKNEEKENETEKSRRAESIDGQKTQITARIIFCYF
jgi:hypothetical protein